MCSCAKNKDLFRSFIRFTELAIKCHARSQAAKAGRLPGAHHHATLLWLTPVKIAVDAQGRGINATRLFSECPAPHWWARCVCKWQGPPFSLVSLEASLGAKSKVGIKPFLRFGNFGIWSCCEDGISFQSSTPRRSADVHGGQMFVFYVSGYFLLRNWDRIPASWDSFSYKILSFANISHRDREPDAFMHFYSCVKNTIALYLPESSTEEHQEGGWAALAPPRLHKEF